MISFSEQMQQAVQKARNDLMHLHGRVSVAAQNEVKFGGGVTGAPGQPLKSGALRNSYQLTFPTPTTSQIATDKPYARSIELGVGPHGPLTLRSSIGGFHSIALVVAGFDRLVANELAQMQGAK